MIRDAQRNIFKTSFPRGFSLLEMAVSLLVIGVIITPIFLFYNNYQKSEEVVETTANVQGAVDALQNYRRANGEYPCPAPLTAPRGTPEQGRADPVKCDDTAATPGTCADGICYEEAIASRQGALTNPLVVVGAIPFRDLQIEEHNTLDAYGNRLIYAVTQSMTDINTIDDAMGAIDIRNAEDQSLLEPEGSAAYVVLSTGKTEKGAYTQAGNLIESCTGPELDIENCNRGFETGNGPTESTYIASVQGDLSGTSQGYDDYLAYYTQISEPLWKRTVAEIEDIQDLSPEGVGVGVEDAEAGIALHIASDLTDNDSLYAQGATSEFADDGRIMASQICDENGENCFNASVLGAEIDGSDGNGMECDLEGEYAYGVEGGDLLCTEDIQIKCDDPTPVLIGIDEDTGEKICAELPGDGCEAMEKTLCEPNDVSLDAASDETITDWFFRGDCRKRKYRCDDGTWVNHASGGYCVFDDTPQEVCDIPCTDPPYGGHGWEGTYCVTVTPVCDGDPIVENTFEDDCECVGDTVDEEEECSELLGPGWMGIATRTVTYSPPECLPDDPAWNLDDCHCAEPEEETMDCSDLLGGGWTGTATRIVSYEPPDCEPETGDWNTDDCACDATPQTFEFLHDCNIDGLNPDDHGYPEVYDPIECYTPDPSDKDVIEKEVDPEECVVIEPGELIHNGTCKIKNFTWQQPEATGEQAGQLPPQPNFIGDGCSCTDHLNTIPPDTEICYYQGDIEYWMYRCSCL